jgi:hypothetical protein
LNRHFAKIERMTKWPKSYESVLGCIGPHRNVKKKLQQNTIAPNDVVNQKEEKLEEWVR